MKLTQRTRALALATLTAVLLSPLALSHFDDEEVLQSYRQSYFTLVALNFGPVAAMVKGEIPWDEAGVERYANDLVAVTSMDLLRGFPEGSHTGKTRAKPEIWENMSDFESKFSDLRNASLALQEAAASGDKPAIIEAFKSTGGSCKACHDEYKSKNYLN